MLLCSVQGGNRSSHLPIPTAAEVCLDSASGNQRRCRPWSLTSFLRNDGNHRQRSVGQWHDWEELAAIADQLLDHRPACNLLNEIHSIRQSKFEHALVIANEMRTKVLEASLNPRGNRRKQTGPGRGLGSPELVTPSAIAACGTRADPLCDSSETYTRAVWPEPSPAVLRLIFVAGISEVSRFSCMKFLGVPGVFDYAGLNKDSRYRPCSCCLPRILTASASGL
jgi:hypothetical protein